MYLPTRNHRVLIMGRNGAVGANHPLATQAGLDTLRAGGNAVDAAVAISLTLGVVEPGMSGLGGDGFYQVYTAKDGAARCYNATGAAPLAATPSGSAPAALRCVGPLSVSTPGLLAGLGAMHAAHGSMPWAQLFGPGDRARARGLRRHPPLPQLRRRRARSARRRRAVARGVPRRFDSACRARRADPPARSGTHAGGDRRRTAPKHSIAAGWRSVSPPACARPACWSTNATWRQCQPQVQDPIAHRLSRLPRHPDAAELHRLHHAADAEDRRALRLRGARSGAAHSRAGRSEEARVPGSRTLRHRSALRRRAARSAAVRRLRR